eukprot:s4061_g11.t1
MVVETAHPYETADHSFTRRVAIDTEGGIDIHFAPECRTYDHRTTLSIFGGGLSKALVGIGARVHAKVVTGREEAHGTIIGRSEGGLWKVRIDADEAEICGVFQDPAKTVQVTYEEGMTVGSEIAGFRFDVSDPLAPFTVTGFSKKGPAQIAGVMVGWFLDVGALLREEQFISLEGEDFGPLPTTLADAARRVAQNMEATGLNWNPVRF